MTQDKFGCPDKIRVAVARDLWKEPVTVLAPDKQVSVEAAIQEVTINAAWQSHDEDKLGSLEVGKLAESEPEIFAGIISVTGLSKTSVILKWESLTSGMWFFQTATSINQAAQTNAYTFHLRRTS